MTTEKHTCCDRTLNGWEWHKCAKPGKVEVDGKWYCGIHDPTRRKRREAERMARWDAEVRQRNAADRKKRAITKLGELVLANRDAVPAVFAEAIAEYDAACAEVEASR